MNIKKEQIKIKIFLILYILFAIITKRLNNVGYVVIPMLFAIVFSILYRNSKKAIEENNK